ncbi:hypothetical protein LguiA_022044 [Lonicera macranthoides]
MSDYFPTEIIVNILSWLPPRSLLRFRCVCKSWCSLISSPNFIDIHTHQLDASWNHNSRLLAMRWTGRATCGSKVYPLDFDSEILSVDVESVGIDCPFPIPAQCCCTSCKGLFLISCSVFRGLWNPSIRRKLVLGESLFGFDVKRSYFSALGFNPKTNDYKVVNIGSERMGDGSHCSEVRVYSVKEGSWRRISAPAPACDIVRTMSSNVVINGSLYWIANHGVSRTSDFRAISPRNLFDTVDDIAINSIMVFDTVEEVFRMIMLPKSLASAVTPNLRLMVIGGSLSVIQCEKFLILRSIWVMKKDGDVESWSEKYSFDSDLGFRKMLGFRENGELVLSNKDDDLVAYNPITRQSTNLMAGGHNNLYYGTIYKQSLGLLLEGEQISEKQTSDIEPISSERRTEAWISL